MENVFEPSFGNRPERIVGRDSILSQLEESLQSRRGSRKRASLIVGQRGMGKTALLLEVESIAKQSGYVTARSIANERMLQNLIERLQINGRGSAEPKKKLRGMSAGAFGFSLGLTFSEEINQNYGFQTKLGLLCDRLEEADRGILLLVDEVQASSPEMRELADAYQQLVGDGKNIAICMAGLPVSMSHVLNDSVLTFLNRASKIHLDPLDYPSIRSYYASTFERADITFAKGMLDKAVRSTAGYPYLLQLIGYYLFEASRGHAIVTEELLEQALSNARDDMATDVFRPTLSALSHKDMEFLEALANVCDKNDTGSLSDIRKLLGKDNSYVQVYRKRLMDAEVITPAGTGRLQIIVPFLRDYLLEQQQLSAPAE